MAKDRATQTATVGKRNEAVSVIAFSEFYDNGSRCLCRCHRNDHARRHETHGTVECRMGPTVLSSDVVGPRWNFEKLSPTGNRMRSDL